MSSKIKDETFSKQMMGTTIGIIPKGDTFVAPTDGQMIICEGHAFAIQAPNGVQTLVHIGLDTVKIDAKKKAKIFKYSKAVGDSVKVGQEIVKVDFKAIKKLGFDITTPVVVISESVNGKTVSFKNIGPVEAKDILFTVE